MAVNNVPSPRALGIRSSSFDDTWSNRHFNRVKCRCTWTIHNYDYCHYETGNAIESPVFSPEADNTMKWRLHLYSSGDDTEEEEGYISLYLQLVSCDKSEVRTRFELSIRNASNVEINRLGGNNTFLRGTTSGWSKFVLKKYIKPRVNVGAPLADGKLTIVCKLEFLDDVDAIVPPKLPASHVLGTDFELFRVTSRFSDITLTINDKDIQAHKVILAAHSPVFSAMFEQNMEETKQNRVKINDVDYEVFIEILRFMYTNKTSNLEKMAAGMLAAADKYALITLKLMCEEALRKNLTIETAADTLILAHRHSANQLKMQVMQFIFSHSRLVARTETFKSMMVAHVDLAIEISSAFRMRISRNSISAISEE